ncbi:expressed unknown protein [Seminavis robusta]|uniref:TIR domain-containing protein n=1 Tax=Seminavis robusta TaxID=568900 RepID=A0A9N8DTX0_9STRA|nr:expressed unknown protein [Seminavis robusta]|eukprot:Sro273_g105030.1 n/a (138) ;mRNA; f:11005-11418
MSTTSTTTSNSTTPFDVFLIHTSYEKRVEVSAMKDVLETAGFRCFVDRDNLQGSQPYSPPEQMKLALEECRFAVATVSQQFLERKDPVEELFYAFHRMLWIRKHYHWQYLWVVLLDLSVEDYKRVQNQRPKKLPELW